MQYTAEERAMIWLDSLPQIEYRGKIALLRAAKDPAALPGEWEKFSSAVIKDNQPFRLFCLRHKQPHRNLAAVGLNPVIPGLIKGF